MKRMCLLLVVGFVGVRTEAADVDAVTARERPPFSVVISGGSDMTGRRGFLKRVAAGLAGCCLLSPKPAGADPGRLEVGAWPTHADAPTQAKRAIGRILYANRKRQGLTAAQAGRLAGVTGGSLKRAERGKVCPRFRKLMGLANAVGMTPADAAQVVLLSLVVEIGAVPEAARPLAWAALSHVPTEGTSLKKAIRPLCESGRISKAKYVLNLQSIARDAGVQVASA